MQPDLAFENGKSAVPATLNAENKREMIDLTNIEANDSGGQRQSDRSGRAGR